MTSPFEGKRWGPMRALSARGRAPPAGHRGSRPASRPRPPASVGACARHSAPRGGESEAGPQPRGAQRPIHAGQRRRSHAAERSPGAAASAACAVWAAPRRGKQQGAAMAGGGARPGLSGESGRNFPRGQREPHRGPGSRVAVGGAGGGQGVCAGTAARVSAAGVSCGSGRAPACVRARSPRKAAASRRVASRKGPCDPGGAMSMVAVAAPSFRQNRKFAVYPRGGPCGCPCRPV